MTNHEAYKACIQHCRENQHWGTLTALTEDGYDPQIDWVKMYNDWKETEGK